MASRIETGAINEGNKKTVPCVRLRDLLNEEIDFLKIDIEGAEYEVLKDCADEFELCQKPLCGISRNLC